MGINFNPGSEKFNRAVRSEIYVDKTEKRLKKTIFDRFFFVEIY